MHRLREVRDKVTRPAADVKEGEAARVTSASQARAMGPIVGLVSVELCIGLSHAVVELSDTVRLGLVLRGLLSEANQLDPPAAPVVDGDHRAEDPGTLLQLEAQYGVLALAHGAGEFPNHRAEREQARREVRGQPFASMEIDVDVGGGGGLEMVLDLLGGRLGPQVHQPREVSSCGCARDERRIHGAS